MEKYIWTNTLRQIHFTKYIFKNLFVCLFVVRWGTIHYKSIYSNSSAQQLSWWKPNCFVCVIKLKHMRLSLSFHKLFVSFVNLVFSCPEQLNRTHCPLLGLSVCLTKLTIRVFTTLQSDPRDLWPLRHLIRVMRRHDMTKKNYKDKDILRKPPQSNPRDLWPLRHLFRVMRRHDMT